MLLGPTEHVVPTRESRRIERRTARREKNAAFSDTHYQQIIPSPLPFPHKKDPEKGSKSPFFRGTSYAPSPVKHPIFGHERLPFSRRFVARESEVERGGGVPLTFILCSPARLPLEHAKGKTSSFFLHSARLFVPLQAKQWTGLPLASHRRREESPGNTGHSAS